MTTIALTPDQLLWKLAHMAAYRANEAADEDEFWLNLIETTDLLKQIKDVLPKETEWSAYLTPSIVWHTAYSVGCRKQNKLGYNTKEAVVTHIDEVVKSLRKALLSTEETEKGPSGAPDKIYPKGMLSA